MHAYSWPYDWFISRATFLYSSPFSIPIKWALYIHYPMQPYHHLLHQDPIFPRNPPPILTFLKKRMEGGDQNLGNGGSRWNPTKEQINMLESLYKNGLRTPTAEQIQQITARLRDYGHIEGKNVFYWFQNHKARQRQKQKQKQESFAFYNRFLHAAANSPVYPSYQNVICSPCYIPPPKNDAVFYQQHPKVQLHTAQGTFKRSRTLIPQSIDSMKQIPTNQRYNTKSMDWISSSSHQETLDLFPIHPTGILKSRTHDEGDDDDEEREIKNPNFSATDKERCDDDHDHPFFDFFCGN